MGGSKGGSSWLTAVKRAFRSPSKDDEEKKREKRRWSFRRQQSNLQEIKVTQEQNPVTQEQNPLKSASEGQKKRGVTAVVRLNKPCHGAREHYYAILIQTSFRGYLARRALRALKGLVKLQALVRGHNVRKQAKMTLKCMQALVRVQARVIDQRIKLTHETSNVKSSICNINSAIESRYHRDISDRRSISQSREGSRSTIPDDWDERSHTIEEVKAMLQQRRDQIAINRDRSLSQAFSQQIMRASRNPSMGSECELDDRPKWQDQLMRRKPWESRGRASTDQRADSIKTVEIDTSLPYTYLAPNFQRAPQNQHNLQQRANPHSISSPVHHRSYRTSSPHNNSSFTPSPSKTRPLLVRSASPRCIREEKPFPTSQTPSLKSNYYYAMQNQSRGGGGGGGGSSTAVNNVGASLPNYMAATESAKARVRPQSAPKQRPSRPSTPEKERSGSARRRLNFPGGEGGQNLKSPSFKSVNANGEQVGLEQQSNYSSCCTESFGCEISPSSTSDLRRWLR